MKHLAALAPVLAVVLGACSMVYQGYPGVPAPHAELVPAPPSSPVPLIWQPGHYDWSSAGFMWVPGRWVVRAGHGTLWQDGYWRKQGATYVWVPAHWM